MSFVKSLAAAVILAACSLGQAGSASASPLLPVPAAQGSDMIAQAQYYGPPRYERRRYAPARRTVCRTEVRSVRTPAGYWVRRPIRTCRTVYR
jgi:hypothetical protein